MTADKIGFKAESYHFSVDLRLDTADIRDDAVRRNHIFQLLQIFNIFLGRRAQKNVIAVCEILQFTWCIVYDQMFFICFGNRLSMMCGCNHCKFRMKCMQFFGNGTTDESESDKADFLK